MEDRYMGKLGMLVLVVGLVGCGSSNTSPGPTGGGTTYPLPVDGIVLPMDIAAGDCVIVNSAPQQLPASTVAYSITPAAGYADTYEIGLVVSSYNCQFPPSDSYIDDVVTTGGTVSDSGVVPGGIYDLDIICQNAASDCVIQDISWSATY
jgi:hypothetical protein